MCSLNSFVSDVLCRAIFFGVRVALLPFPKEAPVYYRCTGCGVDVNECICP
jgi:hypothetical protein